MTSSSRILLDEETWSKLVGSWEQGRSAWIQSSTQVSWHPTVSTLLTVQQYYHAGIQNTKPTRQGSAWHLLILNSDLTAWLCTGLILLLCAGMAALHEAVLTGNLEVVKLLVKYGADVHQRDEDGWTPLHMACSDGYPDIARYHMTFSPSSDTDIIMYIHIYWFLKSKLNIFPMNKQIQTQLLE